ncbi:MAG TPA: nucleotide-binding protein [Planctomycetaceae bacterium]|nr:nucleotide-binding protein [Planctomycetaceae bacterium]
MRDFQTFLADLAKRFDDAIAKFDGPELRATLKRLDEAVSDASASFSGSWLGYHSRVYYSDLKPPPAGARFDPQWGFHGRYSSGTQGDWAEYQYDALYDLLTRSEKSPTLEQILEEAGDVVDAAEPLREELASILSALIEETDDVYLKNLLEKVVAKRAFSVRDFIKTLQPSGKFFSHDIVAIGNGIQTPPHIFLYAQICSVRSSIDTIKAFAQFTRQASLHLEHKEMAKRAKLRKGSKIFIGHGRSSAWRELKDFLHETLKLDYEEFNRGSAAGKTNAGRLGEMLDAVSFAFIVMTAEDETKDGTKQARLNVVHEAGLFQGRLGFERAIVLLEEDCADFSNIHGLVHIPFPPGRIKAAFEEIRQVLQREEIIPPH